MVSNERLKAAINSVYPAVAGRAIRLAEAGEERAAAAWAKHARTLLDALRPAANAAQEDQEHLEQADLDWAWERRQV
jgi:hypothetical protein